MLIHNTPDGKSTHLYTVCVQTTNGVIDVFVARYKTLVLCAGSTLEVELGNLYLTDYFRISTGSFCKLFLGGILGNLIMALHAHSVDSCTGCVLDLSEKVYDSLNLAIHAFIIVIVIKLNISREVLVSVYKGILYELGTLVQCPPAGVLGIASVGSGGIADCFIDNIPAVEHALVLAVGTGKMLRNALDIPLKTAVHQLGSDIRLGSIIILVEEKLGHLGVPYQYMTSDLDEVIGMRIVPVYKEIKVTLRIAEIQNGYSQRLTVKVNGYLFGVCLQHGVGLQFIAQSHGIKMLGYKLHLHGVCKLLIADGGTKAEVVTHDSGNLVPQIVKVVFHALVNAFAGVIHHGDGNLFHSDVERIYLIIIPMRHQSDCFAHTGFGRDEDIFTLAGLRIINLQLFVFGSIQELEGDRAALIRYFNRDAFHLLQVDFLGKVETVFIPESLIGAGVIAGDIICIMSVVQRNVGTVDFDDLRRLFNGTLLQFQSDLFDGNIKRIFRG